MSPDRFQEITSKYASLRIGVVGDFCLDRYLEIDPAKQETSIETGLPVHNVVNVRSQPDGSTLDIASGLEKVIQEMRKQLPPDVKIVSCYDQSLFEADRGGDQSKGSRSKRPEQEARRRRPAW